MNDLRDLRTTRKIDDVGRIVIPKAARTLLELSEGMEMSFFVNEATKEIILRPVAQNSIEQDDLAQAFISKYGADAFTQLLQNNINN
jgi:AbrB family looped-hinge helix DNA binding protein